MYFSMEGVRDRYHELRVGNQAQKTTNQKKYASESQHKINAWCFHWFILKHGPLWSKQWGRKGEKQLYQ